MIAVPLAVAAALSLAVPAPHHAWSSARPDGVHAYSNTTLIRNQVFTVAGRQVIWADSASRWGVTSTQPKGGTAVLSYPDRQDLEYLPLRRLVRLWARYSVNMPARGDYETAFDIWVQPDGDPQDWDRNIEVMIWVNNHGQTPAGRVTGRAVTDTGQRFVIWQDGRKGPDSTTTLVLARPRTHGVIHILSALHWLSDRGYFPASSGLNDVEFGREICSTGGVAETFTTRRYALHRVLRR